MQKQVFTHLCKFNRQWLAQSLALTAGFLSLALVGIVWQFWQALEMVQTMKPLQPRGTTFYAAPKKLTLGQIVLPQTVIAHLTDINYTAQGKTKTAGSYRTEGNALFIYPRLAEHQPVRITFAQNRILALDEITVLEGQEKFRTLNQVEIEPEALGSFTTELAKVNEQHPALVRRHPVQFTEIENTDLYRAVLQREDDRFESHHGVNYLRSAKAGLGALLRQRWGGGSTISSQVCKVNLLRSEKSFARKYQEFFAVAALEYEWEKPQIFTLYCNTIFLGSKNGSQLYGYSAAAEEYFGKKDLRRLSLNEAATLACLNNQPQTYLQALAAGNVAPLQQRRDALLEKLQAAYPQLYASALIAQTKREPITISFVPKPKTSLDNSSEAFVNFAVQSAAFSAAVQAARQDEVAQSSVYLSVDARLMREAQQIIGRAVAAAEKRFPVTNTCGEVGTNRMLGSIFAMTPTGEILTMSGGSQGAEGYRDAFPALHARSPIASAWKPFAQALAFAQNLLDEAGQPLAPDSILKLASGRQATLTDLMATSDNEYAEYLSAQLGAQPLASLYTNIFKQEISPLTPDISLGLHPAMLVSARQIAQAYAMFARGDGRMMEANPISAIYLNGKRMEAGPTPTQAVLSARAVARTREMLRAVVTRGTLAQAFRNAGLPTDQMALVGKTGSSREAVWAVAVTPRLIVVAHLGFLCSPPRDWDATLTNFKAGNTAGEMLAAYLQAVRQWRPDLLAGQFPTTPFTTTQE